MLVTTIEFRDQKRAVGRRRGDRRTMRCQRDIDDAGENDHRDDELAPEGKPGHRPHCVLAQMVALIRAKAHHERTRPPIHAPRS